MRGRVRAAIAAALILVGPSADPAAGQGTERIPHLRAAGRATPLVVDGAPILVLGGELGNSAASDPDHLRGIWPGWRRSMGGAGLAGSGLLLSGDS